LAEQITDCMFRPMTLSAIPVPIQTLLDLFTKSLADVRFADVDGQALTHFAEEVEAAAAAVADAQSALDAAQLALQEKQDRLLQQAQRALAYARVYADSDETLSGQLDAVTLPRAPRRARAEEALVLSADPQPSPRPRGRPRKAPVVVPAFEATLSPGVLPGE
jgi:multidrug efflux pump subunit AcrA (membrane-fusion protein)